jgi:hypothetical protein
MLNKLLGKFKFLRNKATRKGNVAILHHGRCGSTVLGNLLDQNKQMLNKSEIFHHQEFKNPSRAEIKEYIELKMSFDNTPYFLFETKFLSSQHLSAEFINYNLEDYITMLKELGFDQFIVIKRKNYFLRSISAELGRKRKQWHSANKVFEKTKVHIDVNSFIVGDKTMPYLDHFKYMDEEYTRLENILKNDKVLNLVYEEDIEKDPKIAYSKVCEFLNITNQDVQVTFKKLNKEKFSEIIENSEEIENLLSKTAYKWMLETT